MQSKQQLWNNVYRIVLPKLGFSLDNIDKEGLKIAFAVEKDLTQNTNKTKLALKQYSRGCGSQSKSFSLTTAYIRAFF